MNITLTEGFGISIIEAASCGNYIVSTNVGAIHELFPPDCMSLADINS